MRARQEARFVFKEPMKGPPGAGQPRCPARPAPVRRRREASPAVASGHGHRGPARAGARVGYVLEI
jgi:hypothetical protein